MPKKCADKLIVGMVEYVQMKGVPVGGPAIDLLIAYIVEDSQRGIPQPLHLEVNQWIGKYFGKWRQGRIRSPVEGIDNRGIPGKLRTVNTVGPGHRSILLP